MKFSALAISSMLVSVAMISGAAHANDAPSKETEAMQEFNDAQFCAVLLTKLGGKENQQKSARALAQAKVIAPTVGYASEEAFNQSYDQISEILGMVDKNEMKEFTTACTAKWS